jgi:uncharacterized membrane protein YfhO
MKSIQRAIKDLFGPLETAMHANGQLVVFLGITAIWCYAFSEYLLFHKSFVFDQFAVDSLSQFYPIKYFWLSNLLNGNFPFWSFQLDLGINVYALMANANPFDLVFLLFGPDQFIDAIPMVVYLKYLATGLFFHAFLRKLSVEPIAAIIGSLLFTFSGHMVINSHWYHYSNYVVFSALFLYFFELWFQDGRWLPLVIVIGLVALKGELQLFQMGCFGSVYVFWRGYNRFGWSAALVRTYLYLGALYLAGMCLGAFVYLPNVVAMFHSSRVKSAIHDLSFFEKILNLISFEEWTNVKVLLARLFSADMLGSWLSYRGTLNYFEDSTLYVGLLPVLLLPLVLFFPKERRLVWLFPLTAFLAIFFPSIRLALNGFVSGTFKYVSLYGGFFLLFPAILLLSQLFEGSAAKKSVALHRALGAVYLAAAVLVLLQYAGGLEALQQEINMDSAVFQRTVLFTVVYLTGLFVLFATGRVQALKYCFLLLVIFEVALAARMTVYRNPGALTPFFVARGENYFDSGTGRALKYIADRDSSFFRIEKGYNDVHLNDSLIQNYFGTQSYFGFAPQGVVDFYRSMGLSQQSPRLASYRYGFEKRSALQSLFTVKYFLCREDEQCSGLVGFTPIKSVDDVRIYANDHVWPFGRLFHQQMQKDLFTGLSVEAKDVALLYALVVESPQGKIPFYKPTEKSVSYEEMVDAADQDHETLQLEKWNQELFVGRITANREGILFFPVPYDRGWHLNVNGKPAELLQVDYGFCGAHLPADGTYEVQLYYTPPFFATALLISAVSLVLCLLLRAFMPRLYIA